MKSFSLPQTQIHCWPMIWDSHRAAPGTQEAHKTQQRRRQGTAAPGEG